MLVKMMKSDVIEDQMCAAKAVWTLSFEDTSRVLIKKEPGCIEALEKLQKSSDPKVRTQADGALWVIMEKDAGRTGMGCDVTSCIHWYVNNDPLICTKMLYIFQMSIRKF